MEPQNCDIQDRRFLFQTQKGSRFSGVLGGLPVISSRQGKWLLETGSDVKERDSCQWTPLHAASAEGHTEVVEWLLKQGGGPFLRTTEMSQK
jgi:ankyrin repeat protein